MRRFLFWFGAFAAVVTVLAIAGFGYVAYVGRGLDTGAKQYADQVVNAATARWDSEELLRQASPNLLKSSSAEQVRDLFGMFAMLGPLQENRGCEGQTTTMVSVTGQGSVTGRYACSVRYHKSEATVQLNLIRLDERWKVNGFHVNSPAFLPQTR